MNNESEENVNIPKDKNVIFFIVILVALVFLNRQIYLFNYKLKLGWDKKVEEAKETRKLVDKWKKVNSEYAKVSENFFGGDKINCKKFVERSAQISGISIEFLKTSNNDRDAYWESTINLKGKCSYQDIISFLGQIEKKNIEVVRMDMKKEKEVIANIELKGIILK